MEVIMVKIKKTVDLIDDELKGAERWAEDYIYAKANGDPDYNKYREMANQELDHASFLHQRVTREINTVNQVYTPTQEMIDKWEHTHKEYVDKVARIRMMIQ